MPREGARCGAAPSPHCGRTLPPRRPQRVFAPSLFRGTPAKDTPSLLPVSHKMPTPLKRAGPTVFEVPTVTVPACTSRTLAQNAKHPPSLTNPSSYFSYKNRSSHLGKSRLAKSLGSLGLISIVESLKRAIVLFLFSVKMARQPSCHLHNVQKVH